MGIWKRAYYRDRSPNLNRGGYRNAILNSIWGEIEDRTMADVRTLDDATKGVSIHLIWLTMKPTRPSISDSMRITDDLKFPIGSKFDGGKEHRTVTTPGD